MTKVSVIIPVYNTASYLKECIDSVLRQTLDDIEVICVNDGSTDSSLEILESYKLKDDRIVLINQKNRGLGAARNIALKHASGKYVLFLDSDDYLDEMALEDLYDLATRKSIDLLIFKLINFNNETYKEVKYKYFEMDFLKRIVDDDIFNWKMVKNKIFDMAVTAPAKFFKMDLIKNIYFPENLIFEDSLFFIKVIFRARRVYFYDRHLYHRRVRSDSITNSNFRNFSDCIEIYDLINRHLKKIRLYDDFADQLFNRQCRDIFTRFSGVPEEFKEDFFVKINEYFTKNKKTLQREGTLDICNERALAIFNAAVDSATYREFELSVNIFDLEMKHDKLRLENDILKRQNEKRINDLTNQNQLYIEEIGNLNSSVGLNISKFFKRVFNFIGAVFAKIFGKN